MRTVSIVITTYFREEDGAKRVRVALEAAKSWKKYLKLDDGYFHIHIADDGSVDKYLTFFLRHLKKIWEHEIVTVSCQQRHGVGASLNKGFDKSFEHSDVVYYAVDDWALTRCYDLTPWYDALNDDPEVGMIRLGPPHPQLRGRIYLFWGGWSLLLERYGFVYGQRPALYHKRFHEYYGPYPEDCNALECERMYNERVCRMKEGPEIVLALPDFFEHIESAHLSDVEPR